MCVWRLRRAAASKSRCVSVCVHGKTYPRANTCGDRRRVVLFAASMARASMLVYDDAGRRPRPAGTADTTSGATRPLRLREILVGLRARGGR